MGQQFLTYGLYEGNELKHVSDVDNGMACNCICAHCKHPLVAKNNPNNKKIAHFAHKSGKECDGAIETALHLLAKVVLSKTKKLKLPLYHYDYNPYNKASVFPNDDTFVVNKELIFDEVLLETSVTIDGEKFIPDAIGKYKGKVIYIEFAKTHFVDEKKEGKIKKSGMACIEINLSDVITNENTLIEFFNSDSTSKYWVANPKLDNKYNNYTKEQLLLELQEQENNKKRSAERKYYRYADQNLGYYRFIFADEHCTDCPLKWKNALNTLKNTSYYQNILLKRIIDGEHWNKIIYGHVSTVFSIYLNKREKISFYSSENTFLTPEEQKENRILLEGLQKISEKYRGYCCNCRFLMDRFIYNGVDYGVCIFHIT